jgi:hypothetical protein
MLLEGGADVNAQDGDDGNAIYMDPGVVMIFLGPVELFLGPAQLEPDAKECGPGDWFPWCKSVALGIALTV